MAYTLSWFVEVLEQDEYHSVLGIKPEIEPLVSKVRSLRDLLIEHTSYPETTSELKHLESRAIDATHKAEDLVQGYVRSSVQDGSSSLSLPVVLKDVMDEFDSIAEQLLKIVVLGKAFVVPDYTLSGLINLLEKGKKLHFVTHEMSVIKLHIKLLLSKARFLRDLFIRFTLKSPDPRVIQLRDPIRRAEHVINDYARSAPQDGSSSSSLPVLKDVVDEFDSIALRLTMEGLGPDHELRSTWPDIFHSLSGLIDLLEEGKKHPVTHEMSMMIKLHIKLLLSKTRFLRDLFILFIQKCHYSVTSSGEISDWVVQVRKDIHMANLLVGSYGSSSLPVMKDVMVEFDSIAEQLLLKIVGLGPAHELLSSWADMIHTLSGLINLLEKDEIYSVTQEYEIYSVTHDTSMIKHQIELLLSKARSLRDLSIQEGHCSVTSSQISGWVTQVRNSANYFINEYARYASQDGSSSPSWSSLLQVLHCRFSIFPTLHTLLKYVTDDFDSVTHEISKITDGQDHHALAHKLILSSPEHQPSSKNNNYPRSNNTVVGLQPRLDNFMRHQINQPKLQLHILAIAGMGGLGKTTMAKEIYNHQTVVDKFQIRAWVTISHEYNVKAILLALLNGLGKLTAKMHQEEPDQLGKYVHNFLKHRTYFIVLDDLWDIEAWDKIVSFFPDDPRGSRILVTTWSELVAGHVVDSRGRASHLNFGRSDDMEELLRGELFDEEKFPADLQSVIKHIMNLCKGLPLNVKVIAGLLSTAKKIPQFWEVIHTSLSLATSSAQLPEPREAISVCYNYLPYYLKPSLLYMGAFPEDHEISASKVINLWIAEGLIKPVPGNSLEETAEVYLNALIQRNLLSICQQEPTGRIKIFKIHDILRDFCQEKAIEDNFLWYKDLTGANIPDNEKIVRRVGAPALSKPGDKVELMTHARSFLCVGKTPLRLAPMFLGLMFLRVLDVFELEFYQFPEEIFQLVLLRFLAFSCHAELSASISKLRNLQTLIMRRLPSFRAFSLPPELWELTQLRHVKSNETCVWYFPTDGDKALQCNLQTLLNVQLFGVTNEFLETIPNVRKLGIFCDIAMKNVFDLARLHKLERLKCSSDWSLASHAFLSFLTFPSSLKKLTLSLCRIPWGFMATIGSLPNLELLKLLKSDFLGRHSERTEPEWKPAEGEFASLMLLQMEDLNLVHWNARSINFPELRRLVIKRCPIRIMSTDIGRIPKIELIEVDRFSPWLIDSAKQIQEEQQSLGNKLLQVRYMR